jgi:hypothetical protein
MSKLLLKCLYPALFDLNLRDIRNVVHGGLQFLFGQGGVLDMEEMVT